MRVKSDRVIDASRVPRRILFAPLDAEKAEQLREMRSQNVRSSLDLLCPENPQVRQVRLTPWVRSAIATGHPYRAIDASIGSCTSARTSVADCNEQETASCTGSAPLVPIAVSSLEGAPTKHSLSTLEDGGSTVAERVAELQRNASATPALEAPGCNAAPEKQLVHTPSLASSKPQSEEASEVGERKQSYRQWLLELLFDELKPWFKCAAGVSGSRQLPSPCPVWCTSQYVHAPML